MEQTLMTKKTTDESFKTSLVEITPEEYGVMVPKDKLKQLANTHEIFKIMASMGLYETDIFKRAEEILDARLENANVSK